MALSPTLLDRLRLANAAPRLSDDMLTLVGLIVVHWAAIEHELKQCLATAADIPNGAVGRLIFREPRASDYPSLIGQVLEVRGIEVNWAELKALAKRLLEAGERRNELAHGVWKPVPKDGGGHSHGLLVTVGKWPDGQQEPFGMKGATSKKVVRHITEFEVPDAERILNVLLDLGNDVVRLKLDLIGLRSSPPESPAQPPRKAGRGTSTKRLLRPRSSRV